MPALVPTDHHATITWMGYVPPRDGPVIVTRALTDMPLDFGGYAGAMHTGVTRAACSRVKTQHPRGTQIANVRQLSIVSDEEMAQIAEKIGLDALDPHWLGASLVLRGLPDLTHLPPSSRLQSDDGTTLVVDMENQPCTQVSLTMKPDAPEAAPGFKSAAKGKRGITAWVERPGTLRIGDRLRLHVPAQRAWQG